MTSMLNFTVGPVQMSDEIRSLGFNQIPYFRTAEFSAVMLENERILMKLVAAPEKSRAVFLTGSGTAGMEAAVCNTLDGSDRAVVVSGGSFGRRFSELCDIHGVPHDVIALEPGSLLSGDQLERVANGATALLVNMGETSTGVLYDMGMIGEFCRRRGLFLIVDAISTFLADPVDMAAWGADVVIVGSQKALAVPPGVSALVLSPRAQERIARIDPHCLYLNLSKALSDGQRGQTPFTPAVGTLLQLNARLRSIDERGIETELDHVRGLAVDFRERVASLPVEPFAKNPSMAVTSLRSVGFSARRLFDVLKDDYGMWVCPNGGALADEVFRVGHIGCLTREDNRRLVFAMEKAIARLVSEESAS